MLYDDCAMCDRYTDRQTYMAYPHKIFTQFQEGGGGYGGGEQGGRMQCIRLTSSPAWTYSEDVYRRRGRRRDGGGGGGGRGGGPKYLQCRPAFPDDSVSLLLRKLESPSQPLTPPAPPSVEDICYKIIYMYKKKREEKKKSILRFYLSHDRPEMKEEYKFIYFE